MNYELTLKQGRLNALREFFKLNNRHTDDHYLDWFYENFLGICKNIGYLHANNEQLSSSPYATFALHIYDLGH